MKNIKNKQKTTYWFRDQIFENLTPKEKEDYEKQIENQVETINELLKNNYQLKIQVHFFEKRHKELLKLYNKLRRRHEYIMNKIAKEIGIK